MAKRRTLIDRLPLAPVFALMFGTAVAIVVAAMPQWRYEQAIGWTGLGSLLAVARPPLGLKARLLGVMLVFALVAIIMWLAVTVVERALAARSPAQDDDDLLDLAAFAETLPPLDKPRRPIFADKELGAPFMSDEALKTAPIAQPFVDEMEPAPPIADIVAPAVAETPEAAIEPSALEAPLDVAEFDLPPAPPDFAVLPGESSIDTLIRRLEAGMARRAGPRPPGPPTFRSPSPGAGPLSAMRDLMERNRDGDVPDESGAARALDTLQRLASRRLAV